MYYDVADKIRLLETTITTRGEVLDQMQDNDDSIDELAEEIDMLKHIKSDIKDYYDLITILAKNIDKEGVG